MKRVTIVLLVFVAGMLLGWIVLSLSGCQTVQGVLGDSAWLLQKGADNITTE